VAKLEAVEARNRGTRLKHGAGGAFVFAVLSNRAKHSKRNSPELIKEFLCEFNF